MKKWKNLSKKAQNLSIFLKQKFNFYTNQMVNNWRTEYSKSQLTGENNTMNKKTAEIVNKTTKQQ